MSDAVETIDDGDEVFLGGFGYNQPYSAVHELIRQGRSDLRIARTSGDTLLDQLIGAGCVSEVTSSHCWNAIGPTPTHAFRRAVEDGDPTDVAFEEHGLGNLVLRLFAGARRLPFVPAGPVEGTGQFEHRVEDDKFEPVTVGGEKHHVMQPLNPDVGVIHVHRADESGNVQIDGARAAMRYGAMACDRLIAVTEGVVTTDEIKQAPESTIVPSFVVDAVVESPGGSHPAGVLGRYERDVAYFEHYGEVTATRSGFEDYLDEWVYGVADRAAYLDRLEAAGFGEVVA